MARILFVEDDAALARGVLALVRGGGHAVDHVDTGGLALEWLEDGAYDLVILDVGLPDMSGFDVLRALRRERGALPVLLLTARDAVSDRVAGLDLGADDYMLKPFEPTELAARIRALLRRMGGGGSALLTAGALICDQAAGTVTINGRLVALRRREWALLVSLLNKAGKVVARERLQDELFGFDEPVSPNALELYVARLRKKLQPDGPTIRTLRGLGYMILP